MKMGARHPIFLGETAGIADFIQNDARYVKGGYKRLEKILKKIDEFEAELVTEKGNWEEARFSSLQGCDSDSKTHSDRTTLRIQEQAEQHTLTRQHAAKIVALKGTIAEELNAETSNAGDMRGFIDEVAGKFNTYWNNAEERHQVRNVLMQALWLVCTGFANFRHTEYCTNIRQQPDFDEQSVAQFTVESKDDSAGKKEIYDLQVDSYAFGETMDPVWRNQKQFDAQSVNLDDGDPDMNKGFVSNKAPWGVDPAGMEKRTGASASAEATGTDAPTVTPVSNAPTAAPARRLLSDTDEDEELGESNEEEAQNMTNEEMSARLSFLIDGANVPRHISVPINALIQSVESDDTAVTEGLVEALVNMDVEEGQEQSKEDHGFYLLMNTKRKEMFLKAGTMKDEKHEQLDQFESIEDLMAEQLTIYNSELAAYATHKTNTATQMQGDSDCELANIEAEATLEAIVGEEVNLMRLNSLLRFLVIGDKPDCSAWTDCDTGPDPGGSCTWRNRGMQPSGGVDSLECETETGQDIACDYQDSYPTSPAMAAVTDKVGVRNPSTGTFDNDSKFCACEYGRWGTSEEKCDHKMCPGYGRILYPGNEPNGGMGSLVSNGMKIGPYGKTADQYFKLGADTPPASEDVYKLLAVCSGVREMQHGYCEPATGSCSYCFRSMNENWNSLGPLSEPEHTLAETSIDNAWNRTPDYGGSGDSKFVRLGIRQSYPISGTYSKCEDNWVYKVEIGFPDYEYARPTSMSICTGRGQAEVDHAGSYTGRCVCDETTGTSAFYGNACEQHKCNDDESGTKQLLWYEPGFGGNCQGRGICNKLDGLCDCDQYSTGATCHEKRCPGYTPGSEPAQVAQECGAGTGECDLTTGRCQCVAGVSCGHQGMNGECPGPCRFIDCENNCGSTDNIDGLSEMGWCDRFSGTCACTGVFNGPGCRPIEKGGDMLYTHETAVWTGTMDKWGWSTCPSDMLLTGMWTDGKGDSDALYNLDQGQCQKPWESGQPIPLAIEPSRCYHENWWKQMDSKGGKFCRRNYFIAGFFRSHCNSLYCIEMAKCCSVKRSIWRDCSWTNVAGSGSWIHTGPKANPSSAAKFSVSTALADQFIVGIFREEQHTLSGITYLRQCSPLWWGQFGQNKVRQDDAVASA